jgi:hypothetical protein
MYELLKAKWSRIVAKMEKRRRNCRCSEERRLAAADGDFDGDEFMEDAVSAVLLPSFLDWTAIVVEGRVGSSFCEAACR